MKVILVNLNRENTFEIPADVLMRWIKLVSRASAEQGVVLDWEILHILMTCLGYFPRGQDGYLKDWEHNALLKANA